jgi:hypothetical protein
VVVVVAQTIRRQTKKVMMMIIIIIEGRTSLKVTVVKMKLEKQEMAIMVARD